MCIKCIKKVKSRAHARENRPMTNDLQLLLLLHQGLTGEIQASIRRTEELRAQALRVRGRIQIMEDRQRRADRKEPANA